MSQIDTTVSGAEQVSSGPDPQFAPQWGPDAPRGARTVLNRIIKEGANVPLFLGQTLINSLRDLGYNDTTSAVCEHVDNAIQWGATEVRVYFNQTGKRGEYVIDVLVYDNGKGMAANVLRAAMAFGGSMCFNNREGIGRYGLGMKAAALSLGPLLDVYSWQERGAIYNMTLDVDEISNDRGNVVNLPEPVFRRDFPVEIHNILVKPLSYPDPRNPQKPIDLLVNDPNRLEELIDPSGTIVYIPRCDRVSHRKASTLVDDATKEMARIYRRPLARGLKLYINNRRVDPFDPTYWMESAWHARVEGLVEKRSRIVQHWAIEIPLEEGKESGKFGTADVRLFRLPIAEWDQLPQKVQKNDLKIFDNRGVTCVRSDREVYVGPMASIVGQFKSTDSWWRLEIDFPAELDEAFGVAVNKQGVRPKGYVCKRIQEKIKEELKNVRTSIEQHWAERAAASKDAMDRLTEAERRANEAESLQATVLDQPMTRDADEQAQLEQNLRALAIGLRREDETDEQAYERVKNSRYITVFKHDEYWPFYHVDNKFGRIILTINTAHPFFGRIYEPVSLLAQRAIMVSQANGDEELEPDLSARCAEAVVGLQLLLLSLARTQSAMTANDGEGELQRTFDMLRRQWSQNLTTQLSLR